ncbi:MAG: autotransporter domain-containing protein [Rickettsiales bacterium]|nr:autotransporter domain-containing protein [Pseudomonadota bacterium]MDA0965874.1 autotransporter domain-containing protein [Pseudomonadota bacterium]MDG4542656.1 autotransporter domain-containing protein [Rickettsiales bacterium]MDG4545160.1 autotransporter domain-containing protein [Rickettsiales bacterium]MDG4547283.1 autotransporter domain-containing protein [Rickettsiales bacterium]
MITKSLRKNLMTTASAVTLGALAMSPANAANLGTAASTVTSEVLTSNITLTGANSNAAGTTSGAILLNASSNGFTLTTGANTISGVGGGGNADTIKVGADTTANIVVSAGGKITATGANATAAIEVANNLGDITVATTGTIETTANDGNVIEITTGKVLDLIDNTGLISANGSGEAIKSLGNGGNITTLTNNAGGKITTTTGSAIMFVGTASSTITNAGTIEASGAGVTISIAAALTGSITNSGTISSVGGAQTILATGAVSGGITNTGTISNTGAGLTVSLIADTALTNDTGGTISNAGGTAAVHTGGAIALMTNKGTISETTGAGLQVNTGALTKLDNTGTIQATTGIAIDANAAITTLNNTGGLIKATAGTGIDNTGGAITTLTNTGTIQDTTTGKGILAAAAITTLNNTGGTISSATGSAIQNTAAITTLTNTGTITSGALTFDIDAAVTNLNNTTGTISSTSSTTSAIDVATGLTMDIDNDSSITSQGTAATINFAGTTTGGINNSGTIQNSSTGAAINVVTDLSTATGIITNSGLVQSVGNAIVVADMDGTITNSGTIKSTGAATSAISMTTFTGANLTSDNYINNSGLITAAGTAATVILGDAATGAGDGITNSGTISNTGTGGVITLASSNDGDETITITNTGNITAASATNSAILGSTGVDTLNWHGGSITGTIDLDGDNGDVINVGDSSTDSITTGGEVSTDIVNVDNGTFSVGHKFNMEGTGKDFIIDQGATTVVTAAVAIDDAGGATVDFDNNGTLKVNSDVTFTIDGTYDQSASAALQVGITSGTADDSDKVVSTGAATFVNGADISAIVNTTNYVATGTTYDIFEDNSGGAITATAANLDVTDDSYILSFAASLTTTDVANDTLTLTATRANTYNSASSLANESAVGAALEAIGVTTDAGILAIQAELDNFTTAAQIESSLATLNPEMSGAINAAATAAAEAGFGVVGNRLDQLAGISGTGVAAGGMSYNHGVWGEVFGTAADQNDRDGVKGYQADTLGFGIGADTALSEETKVGASFAYASTEADSANGDTDIDSYQLSLYGTHDYGKWFTDGLLGFTMNKFDTTRNIVVGTISNQAKGDFDGQQYTAKIGAGYKMDVEGGLNVTPVASLKYNYLALDSYTETGSAQALTVDNEDLHSLKTDIGVKLNYPIVDGSMTYIPEISTSWTYDLIGDEQEAKNNFVGVAATQFTTKGADVAQHQFNVGLGLDVLAQDNVTVSFDYDWASKEDYNSHSGAVKARFAF